MKIKMWIWTAVIAGLMVWGSSLFWLPANRSVLSGGDPTRVEHRSIDESAPIWVKSVLPGGHAVWKKFDLDREGIPMRDFIHRMFRETFGVEEGAAGLPHIVHVVARHPDGTVFYDHTWHNLRTNAGINWQYNQMAGTTAAVCTYIVLTNTAITPNATDTSLSGEITTNGLSRALGTASHTSNATSYTVANTFTATAAQSAQATGLFNASSSGTMCFENTFTQASLSTNDTLTVTWTITF
jgi:hypothetical protein